LVSAATPVVAGFELSTEEMSDGTTIAGHRDRLTKEVT
jgi:hypothetical protein